MKFPFISFLFCLPLMGVVSCSTVDTADESNERRADGTTVTKPTTEVVDDTEVPGIPDPQIPDTLDPVEPEPDVPVEPEPDVPVEPEPDVPVEPELDVPVEPEPDVPGEPEPDVPVEPEPDVPGEPEPDVPQVVSEQPVYSAGEAMNNLVAKRVAKKVNFWGKKEIVPEFSAFNVSDADLDVLYNVRIAQVASPNVHKNVIFMTAGQKQSSSGHANGVTGQAADWDKNCDDVQCTGLSLDARSMAMKIKSYHWFDDAWFAVGVDNNFDYTMLNSKRKRLVEGFTNWIKAQITSDTENIVLAGSSRGGCLVTLIAQELRKIQAYDNINIYVSSYDGVCNKGSELGVSTTKINNPVAPSGTFYGGWATDMKSQFPNQTNLHIYHIAGGQEVVAAVGVRTFSAYEGDNPPKTGTNIDWGWYKQTWVPWKHKEIGNPFTQPDPEDQASTVADTIDAQLWWLENLI